MKKSVMLGTLCAAMAFSFCGCFGTGSSKAKMSEEFKELSDNAKSVTKKVCKAKLADEKGLKTIKKDSDMDDIHGQFDDPLYYQFSRGSVKDIKMDSDVVDGDDLQNVFMFRATDGDDAMIVMDIYEINDEDLAKDYYDELLESWSLESIGIDAPGHYDILDAGQKDTKKTHSAIIASEYRDATQAVYIEVKESTVIIFIYMGTYDSDLLQDYYDICNKMDMDDMEEVLYDS